MTSTVKTGPSRGRLFKLFTDLGPYFRRLQSTESSFYFDCLEICIDAEKEPEEREFYGWWLVVTENNTCFEYERFNGRYNLEGEWAAESIAKKDQKQLDHSFELFIERLQKLIDTETGKTFTELQTELTEV
ncbi:sigma factor-binding protein Crl [Psychromonas ossibalaenae]|uniref:sigma factor-binding protein Crl n=1 Tax=Psychromonas ossibalaenae TaxID=444922 RepID=UPI0003782B35|nr:sigma factor-binding protein Crl [Psychromonas ossibalaenae]